jgi:hypothetical protein
MTPKRAVEPDNTRLCVLVATTILIVAGCVAVSPPEEPADWSPDQDMIARIESLISLPDCPGSIREYERYYTGVFLPPDNRRVVMGYIIGPLTDADPSRLVYPSGRTYPSFHIVPLEQVPEFTDVGCYVTFDVQTQTVTEGIPVPP